MKRILEPPIIVKQEEAYLETNSLLSNLDANFIKLFISDIPTGAKVLDVGCGNGHILKKIQEQRKDLSLYGLDNSAFMIKVAKQSNKKITFKQSTALKIPFKSGSFDYVISSSFLHHISRPEKAIAEMDRVTKENGRIIIRDLIRPSSKKELEKILLKRRRSKLLKELLKASLFAALTIAEMEQLLAKAGLKKYKILRRGIRFIITIKM